MIDDLKQAVRQSGLSLWDLSKRTGSSVVPPELSRWLHNKSCLGQAKLDAVAAAVGASVVVRGETKSDRIARKRRELAAAASAVESSRNAELAANLVRQS